MDFKDITQHFKKVHLIGIVFIIAFNLVYFSPQLEILRPKSEKVCFDSNNFKNL